MRVRHIWLIAVLALFACKRDAGTPPPPGELESLLTAPTLTGPAFQPQTLDGRVTMVTFWSPG